MFLTTPNEAINSLDLPMAECFIPVTQEHTSNSLKADSYFTPKSAKKLMTYTATEQVKEFLAVSVAPKKLSPKTFLQYQKHLQTFLDLWLIDDLNELDRENAELLLGLLYKMPKQPNRNKKLHGLKGIALVQRNAELGGNVISRRTVKKYINLLSTFFNWAQSRGYVYENPFYKLRVHQALSSDRRYQLSSNDLTLIFTMKDYQAHRYLHPYYYWIPLLLRFSGARLNELCQLNTNDVVAVNGVWGICINARYEGQRLKNENSMRFVPLHQALISRGFLEFVEACDAQRLFNELPAVKGYYSHNASKWFARRRKSLAFEKGKDAHSFRHSFINELKQQEVSIDIIQEIVGHSSNSITTSVYSRSYQPEILLAALSKLDDSHVSAVKQYFN
ncbi:site-specific integrase [Vibrio splendidus]|uniref:site-specific integrase n=1 Tax=Vibrio splendidus TaxID=29497 RepID=UPI000315C50F|nr:site-specific integrase [Vibrio splendidus]